MKGALRGRFDCCGEDVQAALELLVGRGERRQQPDHVAVEATREEQESVLPGLRRDGPRHLAGTLDELDRAHRPEASGLADRRLVLGELLEPAADEAADRLSALAEAGLDKRVEDGARGGAGDGVSAKRAAAAAGMYCV